MPLVFPLAEIDSIAPGIPQPVVGDLTELVLKGVVVKVEPLNLNAFATSFFAPHIKSSVLDCCCSNRPDRHGYDESTTRFG